MVNFLVDHLSLFPSFILKGSQIEVYKSLVSYLRSDKRNNDHILEGSYSQFMLKTNHKNEDDI